MSFYPIFKRISDFFIAFFVLYITIPLWLLIAIAIKLGDGGPIFYRQTRIGKNTKTFSMYKFRSMVINADQIGSFSTQANDSRITKIGQLLRKTSLDELPQLLNVLLGDMSLIGPRPDVPAQESQYTQEQWQQRHQIRPGITGLAQATVRSDASMEQRTALDLQYVKEYSFKMDMKILIQTFFTVLKRKGTN